MTQNRMRLSEIVLPAYYDMWNTDATYIMNNGGRGSGKSYNAALYWIINLMRFPLANLLVIRKVERTLRDSCFADLRRVIHTLGLDDYWRCTTSPLEIEYIPTGQKILFRGLDDPLKTTSISVPRGYLCWIWLEECFEIRNESDFDILDESVRGQFPTGYHKKVIGTFNPWNEHHWLKQRFFDNPSDDVYTLTTTYLDNPYLSDTDKKLFEDMKTRNPRRYWVAGLGHWGITEGCIYENWEENPFDIDSIRQMPQIKSFFGLDFGYTNDPSAFVCGLIDTTAKTIWIFDEIYEKGMSNERIAEKIKAAGYAKEKIIADSAEPKSIDRLRTLGIQRIRPAQKGKDSIRNGIDFLQDYHMIIHPRCVNFITEISNYMWRKDPHTGKSTNVPEDDFNHLMDALRYATEEYQKPTISVKLKPRGL